MAEPTSKDLQDFEADDNLKDFDEEEESEGEEGKTPEPGQPEKKTPEGEKEPESTDSEPSEGGKDEDIEGEKEPEEPRVPYSRFAKVNQELRELREKIASQETKPTAEMTEDEKKELQADRWLEKKLETIITRREQRQKDQDQQEASELVDLMEIYGEFDVDKVLDVKDEFRRKGSSLSSEGALAIYFERQKSGAKPKGAKDDKPKVPQPGATGGGGPEKKKPEVTGKPLSQVIQEAKKDYDIKT